MLLRRLQLVVKGKSLRGWIDTTESGAIDKRILNNQKKSMESSRTSGVTSNKRKRQWLNANFSEKIFIFYLIFSANTAVFYFCGI